MLSLFRSSPRPLAPSTPSINPMNGQKLVTVSSTHTINLSASGSFKSHGGEKFFVTGDDNLFDSRVNTWEGYFTKQEGVTIWGGGGSPLLGALLNAYKCGTLSFKYEDSRPLGIYDRPKAEWPEKE